MQPASHLLKSDPQLDALKVPPQSIEAEQSVLGGLMLDEMAWDQVSEAVAEVDFYRQDHRLIFRVMTKLIDKNTTIPTKANQVFSTADDNQTAVTVHVLQGEREQAAGNKSLGRFDLADIPPAPRGVPQVDVTFDIDANGILNVSAKDKATGKEQSIIIKASSGLSDEEIDEMVKDAEVHADEDKKFQERVNARNQADGLIHATEKSVEELGDKVSDEERASVDTAIADLKQALETDDVEDITAKSEKLGEVSGQIAQRAYEEAQKSEDAAGGAPGAETETAQANDDDVVDADFEEVKEDDK